MKRKNSNAKAFVIALAVLCCSISILSSYYATTVGRVVLSGKFPLEGYVDVSISNKFGRAEKHRVEFTPANHNAPVRIGTAIINAPLDSMYFEFFAPLAADPNKPHLFNVYGIEVTQPFGRNMFFSQARFRDHFLSDDFYSDSSNVLIADSSTGTARLEMHNPMYSGSSLRIVSVSLFLALLAWLIARFSSLSSIPAFSDMGLGREVSSAAEFDMVNGLRGIAALLVLFSHAAPSFFAINVGIAILFVISGFLLSRPYVEDARRIFSFDRLEVYLVKRVKRILPMYYFFITITYLTTSQFDTALRNFLFIEASGHLWPMTQIFVFYVCLPIILVITSALASLHKFLPVVLLVLAAALWEVFMSDWRPFYNGRYFTQFHLFAFLLGVAASYINYGILNLSQSWQSFASRWRHPLSLMLLVLFFLVIVWSAPLRPPALLHPLISQFYFKCVMAAIVIVLALQFSSSFLRVLLANWMLRSIGVIGFSFYLLHGLGIELALNVQSNVFGIAEPSERSWSLTLIAFCFTYVMAVLTYSYIERPFFGRRNSKDLEQSKTIATR